MESRTAGTPWERELLLRGNIARGATSKLTAVVEEYVHYRCDVGARSELWLFCDEKGTRSTWFITSARAAGLSQLHLAKLGERPRITDDIVRQVTRSYPFVDVNWRELREQVNNRVELFDPKSNQVQKLVSTLRNLNLDLADLFPPLLDVSHAPEAGQEIVTQLRLLHSTVGVKLDQFDRAPHRGVLADRKFR